MKWLSKLKNRIIHGDKLCKTCGHPAHNHNEGLIDGCGIIEIANGPHLPWTFESLVAGQHKPCRCKWDGKSKQV